MEDNTKTIQKILLDSIMTVVREEIQKGRSADVVYATITGVDKLGSFYRFTYNGHEYIGHSNLPNFSVGENVYVLFNGSQDENVILCGENVSDGSFNGNKYVTRVLTQYIISDNSTVVPSDDSANWKTGYETQDSDKGRWIRTVTNYSDGSVEYSTPVYTTSGSNETAQDLSDFKQQYEKDKEALQGKVDSKVNVYYSSEAPVGLKSDNIGDIWVDADNGKSQMWDGSKWVEFTTKVPPELLDQVDGKSTIYSTQPTVPYDKNDVWFNGDDIYVCITTKTEGEFDSADWARKETYAHQSTVDANNEAFQNFKNVTYSKDISDLRQKVTAQEQELTGNVDGTFISSLKTTVSEHEQKFDKIGNTISEKVNSMFTEKDGTTLSTFVDKVNAIKQTADGTQENYTKIQNTLNDNYFTKEESKNLISKTADGIKVEVDKNTEKIGYSVSDVKTYYLQNDGTKPSADDSAWSLTAPERIAGKHIWTHTIVTLNSGTSVDKGIIDITGADGVSPTVSAERTGSGVEITITNSDGTTKTATLNDGSKGDRGPQGKDGRSSYVHFAYAQSDDGTVGFSTSTFAGATYIGINYNYEEDDPTTPSSYSWSRLKGDTGPQGPQGEQGIAGATGATGATGPKGADGKTSYIHIKYAPSGSPSDSQITDTPNAYIGVYTDQNPTDSTKASAYTWSKWQGKDGAQGIQGPQGANGKTSYVHFAYSNSADGKSNFSTTYFSGAFYVGTLTDYTQADSTNYTDYTWSRIKGDKGDTGPKGDKGDTGATGLQGIQGPKGDQGIPGKDGATGKTSYFHIKYSSVASPTSSSQMSETPSTYIGTYVDFTEADSTDPKKYTWSQFKGSQGAKGDQGIAGKNGADGRTSYLHIAYATSADGSTGFSTSDSAGKTYIGQYTDFTSADSTDRTKYSWTLIKGEKGDKGATGATGPQGPAGAKGADGKGIKSTAITYQASSSQTTVPSGTWATSVPTLSANNPYLWTRTIITYTDNATSTSYSVSSTLEGIEIGGRNLWINSKGEFSSGYPRSSNYLDVVRQDEVSLPTDATNFVLSFDAKSTADGDKIRSFFYYPSNVINTETSSGEISYHSDGFAFTTLTTEWKRYWIKWTAPVADARNVIAMRLTAGEGTGIVSMRNIKFEVGTVPTDWTPAPEDVDAVTVSTIEEQYYSSTSSSSPTGSNWTNQCPAYIDSHWIWTRTALTRNDGSVTYTDPKLATDLNQINAAITSAQNSAADAQKTASNAITNSTTAVAYTAVQYLKTSSQSVPDQSDSGWTENTQSYESNKYIWMRVLYKLKNGNVNYGNPVCLTAGVQNDINTMKQSFYTDESGAHVKSGDGGETLVQGDGVHIKVNGAEVANYTASGGSITQLNVDNYFFVGAHRVQKYTLNGETGTAFFWKG